MQIAMASSVRASALRPAPFAAALAAAGVGLAVWTGIAPASADPVGPVDPLIPVPSPGQPVSAPPADPAAASVPPAAPQTLLGQFAQAAQMSPLDTMKELLANSGQPATILVAPPTATAAPVPDLLAMAQPLLPQNFRMPTPDQISPYALAPNDNPSPFARIDAWKGVHALVHSNLGRMPGDDLGQPLPGTAPPPGTNIPPGLEQFFAPPAAAPAPPPAPADPAAPPVDPLLLPTAPPTPPN